ncbi:MAG TPA: hypothetical protein VIL63_05705 [Terriglobales bacterium]
MNPARPMKSDIPIYLLAALLGICAGLLEIKLGDLLATALFVMFSTMVLGFMRPKNAWRWIVVVAAFVPVIRIAAYVILKQRPYRAQMWESALGFLTGIAGTYGGVLARKGVDELFRPPE